MPLSKIPAVGVDATGTPDGTTFFRGDNTWSAVTVAALSTASGSAPSYSARAWVNFNGTGAVAIRASANVTSITDNGTADYTVNFTTALTDANYSTVGSSADNNGGTTPTIFWLRSQSTAPTTSAVRVGTRLANNTDGDSAFINIAVFR